MFTRPSVFISTARRLLQSTTRSIIESSSCQAGYTAIESPE